METKSGSLCTSVNPNHQNSLSSIDTSILLITGLLYSAAITLVYLMWVHFWASDFSR